ncbi:MAG: M48 family metallopeptidase [Bacteroidales bacterium]|nr:M48 family metallopeptidase [Bacteroidales bacterium]
MRLTISPPDARVHLSIPFFVTNREVEHFVLSRWEWIIRNREKVLNRPVYKEPDYISGEQHYLFGNNYTLVVESVTSGNNSVVLDNDTIRLHCRPAATRDQRKAQLYEWYRLLLRTKLTELVNEWCERLNERNVTWTIRLMKSEWGSCRAVTRRMVFNLDLARVPVDCIEYVVVHEFTHLVVQNHGPAFKTLMTQRLPNWKILRKKLNEFVKNTKQPI